MKNTVHTGAAVAAVSLLLCAQTFGAPLPWPVAPTNTPPRIANTYGQFQDLGGIHMHEGIDIAVPAGTDVLAVKDGTIRNIFTTGDGYGHYVTIEDIDDEHAGWGYVHLAIDPAITMLGVGGQITAGTKLGTVRAYPDAGTFPDHLHLERDSDANNGWPQFGGGTEHLLDEPQKYFTGYATDGIKPVVDDAMSYRRAADEGNDATPKYMMSKSVGNRTVVGSRAANGSGDIDVIAQATDKRNGFADVLGIKRISLDAQGRPSVSNDKIPLRQDLMNFDGDNFFPNNDNFADFRNPALTQVIYEVDSVRKSKQFGPFYHILTNQDTSAPSAITAGDAAYFWDTDGTRGQLWNDNKADRAPNNAKSAFRDDIYQVFARAVDFALNPGTGTEEIILDNWLQTVASDQAVYNLGDTVAAASGEQFLPGYNVPLYVISIAPTAGNAITSFNILGSAPSGLTDADGVIPFSDVWSSTMKGTFYLFADYDSDGIYIPELDAFTSFSVIPEPGTMALALLPAITLLRRRR